MPVPQYTTEAASFLTWPSAHIHQLLHWAETGQLQTGQLRQIEAIAPLRPGRTAWAALGERLGFMGGAVLLALAVVFFFAYNWDDLHHFAKLALAVCALLGCVAAALPARPDGLPWQAALFGAALCTGALLALIGQIYQTGADIWELFAAWTALMLPFTLLARAWPHWLLCLLVSNLCFLRLASSGGLGQLGYAHLDTTAGMVALGCILNGLWYLAALRCGRWMLAQASRHLERTAGAFALAVLTYGAILGVFAEDSTTLSACKIYLVLFPLAAAGCCWYYRHVRLDLMMLGILSCCALLLGGSILARILFDSKDMLVFGLVVMAAYVLLTSAWLSRWLRNLARQYPHTASTMPGPQHGHTP